MATPHAVLSGGTGCPDCAGAGTSFFEQALRFTLSDIIGESGVISRDRETLGIELDVYVPSLGLAYEPGPWYYHAQRISADAEKARICADSGIRLTTIYTGYPSGEKPPFEGGCITSEANLGVANWEETKEVIEQLLREAGLDRDSVDWESVRLRAVAHSGRRTAAQFVEALREANPSIEVVGEYQSMRTKTAVRCRICGHEWNAIPFNLIRGHGCRACANAKLAEDRRKPLARLIEELAIANPNIELIGEYVNTDTKTLVRCLVCEYTWDAYPNNLLKGEGCPNCQGNRKKTHEEFAAELAVKNPRVMLIGTYTSNREKVLVGCVDCEHKWMASPPDLLRGRACPKCGKERAAAGRRKTHEAFVSQLAKVNPTIEPIDRYAGARTRIRFRYLVCGNKWMATPDNVLRGRGCPPCKKRGRKKNG